MKDYMKLLITGGCGFIGSNFIRCILNKYPAYKICNLDKLTYAGNLDNLSDIEENPNYSFFKGDICDSKIVRKLAKNCDAIINFAAETHVDRSITGPGEFIKTDIFGTFTLLEAAKEFKLKRYIQISTDEVYGSIENGSCTESANLCPNSPYSASKAGADMLVRSYFVTYGIPAIITRSSNNFGPYQYPEKIVPLFITNAIEDKPLPLYGDGKNVRDWLYVLDNCKAIDTVLHKGVPGEAYNIGGGNEVTNIELTKMILKILKKPESLIQNVKDRLGHDRRYSLDCSKIKKDLRIEINSDFAISLRETVDWYMKNENWWQKLKNKDFDKYYKKHYGIKKEG